ncbi:class I adenylate-forming enzyme family protein [Paraburkholderia phosphatilytica]|uniref:class I adenylate-forming enzyme family protein n=1 Tax=Paraburkholderia phosphatilytica TaxID=2282883 RepID=UPI000E50F86B|nr:class I adenylate-forming enzyme family protein [Paraburkholderia phosphatilytica]
MDICAGDGAIVETSSLSSPRCTPAEVDRFIATLRRHALPDGSVVLVGMPNGVRLLRLFFALVAAGYVPAMVSPTTPAERLRQMAEDFRAAAIVKPRLGETLCRELALCDVDAQHGWETGFFSTHTSPVTHAGEVILTTSGTSSEFSSGCVHGFESLRANARKHAEDIGLTAADTVLVNLPLYYSFALVAQAIASIECGARLVIGGPPFIASQYVADLSRHAVTVSSLTPILLRELVVDRASTLPRGLRALTVGGDMLAPEHASAFVTRYPDTALYLTYGITEAGPRVSTCNAHEVDATRFASAGLPMRDTMVRLLDADLLSGGIGELLVHSDTLLKRKIGRNAKSPFIELDGRRWLRTGDIFEIDADGYLFFRNRKSDFIVLNDEKINLAAIKQFCRALPGVLTCKTRTLMGSDALDGYLLDIVVDERMVSPSDADAMRSRILKALKRHERPHSLTLTAVNRQQHEFYK